MDLHVVGPAATPQERAAIDAVLDPEIGAPRSGWAGGTRDTAIDGHVSHGGHEARARRDLLLPALAHAVSGVALAAFISPMWGLGAGALGPTVIMGVHAVIALAALVVYARRAAR